MAALREACAAGHGWAVLPVYAVRDEVHSGRLTVITGADLPTEDFGVWWLRGSPAAHAWVGRAIHWLNRVREALA